MGNISKLQKEHFDDWKKQKESEIVIEVMQIAKEYLITDEHAETFRVEWEKLWEEGKTYLSLKQYAFKNTYTDFIYDVPYIYVRPLYLFD